MPVLVRILLAISGKYFDRRYYLRRKNMDAARIDEVEIDETKKWFTENKPSGEEV